MYNKLHLPTVELISINTHNPIMSAKAMEYSSKHIEFAKKTLFSDTPLGINNIQDIRIPKFATREEYSVFCIHELYKYIETDYVLMVHDDGFVINPHLWTDEFFNYDYIGAPWPGNPNDTSHGRVGNGGFSLRSKKLLNTVKDLPTEEVRENHEDWLMGVVKVDYLKSVGINFAPVEVAMKFSLELPIAECEYDLNKTFGFHGKRSNQHFSKIAMLDNMIVHKSII